MKEIIFIGDNFYKDSNTMMSSIYENKSGKYCRYDWGFMQHDLRMGNTIYIRQATPNEKNIFKKELRKLMEKEKK